MSSNKIKFGVIGQGHIGKRHAEMIRMNPDAELVAICDVKPKEELGLTNIHEKYYQSLTELLKENPQIDVVNVCTPNGLHAEQCIEVINAGKHVVCEKPMALNKADCEKIIFTALQNNKQVFAVMQNRYSPPSAWLKEIVSKNIIGDIYPPSAVSGPVTAQGSAVGSAESCAEKSSWRDSAPYGFVRVSISYPRTPRL
jgi:predicted dehydrogenase